MTSDWMLVCIITFFTWFFTSVFWIAYGSYKADQMRQTHIAEQDVLRKENREMRQMVNQTEMQRRVLGGTKVSKLIGGDG
jgi:hypothetical protein